MKSLATLGCFIVLGCGGTTAKPQAPEPTPLASPNAPTEAVADSARPAADIARDEHRKPFETIALTKMAPGMTVVDLMAGGGYFSELFADTVGPQGTVYVQNTPLVLEKFAEGPITKRLARMNRSWVKRWDKNLDALDLPAGEIDVAFLGLFYHDAFWMEVDRAKMNAAILVGLKPGGLFVVTDHHAEAGSKDRDVKTLHRVDVEVVKGELVAAGFELVEESDLLSHPDDPRSANVFEETIRGKTDRFVLVLRKPTE